MTIPNLYEQQDYRAVNAAIRASVATQRLATLSTPIHSLSWQRWNRAIQGERSWLDEEYVNDAQHLIRRYRGVDDNAESWTVEIVGTVPSHREPAP